MDSDNEIRQLILKNASSDVIRDAARRAGMRTLAEDGWRLVRHGHHHGRRSAERDHGQGSRAHHPASEPAEGAAKQPRAAPRSPTAPAH